MFSTRARRLAPRMILAEAAMAAGALLAVTACSSGAPVASKTQAEPVVPLATSTQLASPSTAPEPESTAPTPQKSQPGKSKPQKSDPPAVPLGPFDTAAQVKALFVALVDNYCGPTHGDGATTPVDPGAATVRRGPTKNEWLVTDKSGDKMVINTSSKRVYSTAGPDGSLPGDYTFGCDGVVFPGTWD